MLLGSVFKLLSYVLFCFVLFELLIKLRSSGPMARGLPPPRCWGEFSLKWDSMPSIG